MPYSSANARFQRRVQVDLSDKSSGGAIQALGVADPVAAAVPPTARTLGFGSDSSLWLGNGSTWSPVSTGNTSGAGLLVTRVSVVDGSVPVAFTGPFGGSTATLVDFVFVKTGSTGGVGAKWKITVDGLSGYWCDVDVNTVTARTVLRPGDTGTDLRLERNTVASGTGIAVVGVGATCTGDLWITWYVNP